MPIDFQIDQSEPKQAICYGRTQQCGLSFCTDRVVAPGTKIRVRIPLDQEQSNNASTASGFEADGHVAWCRVEAKGYTVAVQFGDDLNPYLLRMVEQVCHIESYREQVRAVQGRVLSPDEAACEWVEKYASAFPELLCG